MRSDRYTTDGNAIHWFGTETLKQTMMDRRAWRTTGSSFPGLVHLKTPTGPLALECP